MRSNTTVRRLAGGLAIAAALGGGLIVAERGAAPATVSVAGHSIAATRALVPAIPQRPVLSARPAAATAPQVGSPSVGFPSLGIQPVSLLTPVCDALNLIRRQLFALPPSPAVTAALAVNSLMLAIAHCVPISGN